MNLERKEMTKNPYGYGNPYNPDALKDLNKINKEIEDEMKKEEPDKDKMLELRQRQMLKGMELSAEMINGRTYRGLYPW